VNSFGAQTSSTTPQREPRFCPPFCGGRLLMGSHDGRVDHEVLSLSASFVRISKISSQTPDFAQPLKRLWVLFQLP
jgi:hypothetical protein